MTICSWSLLTRFYVCAIFGLVPIKGNEVTEGVGGGGRGEGEGGGGGGRGVRSPPPPPGLCKFFKSQSREG